MRITLLAFFCFLATVSFTAKAQHAVKAQIGFGYMEHFSLGGTIDLNESHSLSLLYGSNFFIKPEEFSSLLLKYELGFPKLRTGNFTPFASLKGGYAIFTDENYQWQVITIMPSLGMNYPINEKLTFFFETGAAISFEQAAKRLNYNEIGYYKQYLPEVKAGIHYTLFKARP